ncbi:MAG: hypothetical protein JJU10_02010 [Idiomarina sp.]|nr:hypothetical protein [Idiomarina sp.]
MTYRPEAFFRAGFASEQLALLDRALQLYEQAISSSENPVSNWFLRAAYTAESLLSFEQAVRYAKGALHRKPRDVGAARCWYRNLQYLTSSFSKTELQGTPWEADFRHCLDLLITIDNDKDYWLGCLLNHSLAIGDLSRAQVLLEREPSARLAWEASANVDWSPRLMVREGREQILTEKLQSFVYELTYGEQTISLSADDWRAWLYVYGRLIGQGLVVDAYALKHFATQHFWKAQDPLSAYEHWAFMGLQGNQCAVVSEVLKNVILDSSSMEKHQRDRLIAITLDALQRQSKLVEARAFQKMTNPSWLQESGYQDYLNYFDGKSVAIVGPAATGEKSGVEIDEFDIVVRPNFSGQNWLDERKEQLGSLTHVSYYNIGNLRSNPAKFVSGAREAPIDILVLRNVADQRLFRCVSSNIKSRVQFFAEPSAVTGLSFAVSHILFDILLTSAGRIKLFNMDFFLGEQPHLEGYFTQRVDPREAYIKHDVLEAYRRLKVLETSGAVQVDEPLANILALSESDFLARVEKRVQASLRTPHGEH